MNLQKWLLNLTEDKQIVILIDYCQLTPTINAWSDADSIILSFSNLNDQWCLRATGNKSTYSPQELQGQGQSSNEKQWAGIVSTVKAMQDKRKENG